MYGRGLARRAVRLATSPAARPRGRMYGGVPQQRLSFFFGQIRQRERIAAARSHELVDARALQLAIGSVKGDLSDRSALIVLTVNSSHAIWALRSTVPMRHLGGQSTNSSRWLRSRNRSSRSVSHDPRAETCLCKRCTRLRRHVRQAIASIPQLPCGFSSCVW